MTATLDHQRFLDEIVKAGQTMSINEIADRLGWSRGKATLIAHDLYTHGWIAPVCLGPGTTVGLVGRHDTLTVDTPL